MLNKHDFRRKEYLRLEKRMNEVWTKLRNIPWVPLEKPYKDGWFIFYDLRKDIAARRDAPLIRAIVSAGYHRSFTRNEAHVRAIRAGRKSIKGRKGKMVDLSPAHCQLTHQEYNSLEPLFKKYFELNDTSERYRRWGIKEYDLNIPSYWVVLRVKARVVTHIQKKGGQLEKEYEFLRSQYRSYFDMSTNYGKSYPRGKGRTKMRNSIQKFKNGDLDDIQIERMPLVYEY